MISRPANASGGPSARYQVGSRPVDTSRAGCHRADQQANKTLGRRPLVMRGEVLQAVTRQEDAGFVKFHRDNEFGRTARERSGGARVGQSTIARSAREVEPHTPPRFRPDSR